MSYLNNIIDSQKRKSHIFTRLLLLFVLITVSLELLRSRYFLAITHYDLSLDKTSSDTLRILQLTDIHDSQFGSGNDRLIDMARAEHPDVIFITGDLVNSHQAVNDITQAQTLIQSLVEIAPVYLSLGNQEYNLIQNSSLDVVGVFEGAGATVLDFSYIDLELKGHLCRIGGIYGYCQPVVYAMDSHLEHESKFLMEFQDTTACKFLLCHMPVCWVDSYSLYDWDVDVVFSGHAHGGQVRIPYIGGLWAPDQGWFPGELCGIYTTSQQGWETSRKALVKFAKHMKYDTSYYEIHDTYSPSYLVLSRGLGNTDWVPRFNNIPEIIVVDCILK